MVQNISLLNKFLKHFSSCFSTMFALAIYALFKDFTGCYGKNNPYGLSQTPILLLPSPETDFLPLMTSVVQNSSQRRPWVQNGNEEKPTPSLKTKFTLQKNSLIHPLKTLIYSLKPPGNRIYFWRVLSRYFKGFEEIAFHPSHMATMGKKNGRPYFCFLFGFLS